MSLTIVHQPPIYNLSRNPIAVDVTTDQYVKNVGDFTVSKMTFGSKPGLGDYFYVSWMRYSIKITAATPGEVTADTTFTKINYLGSSDIPTWLGDVRNRLMQNILISAYFDIIVSGSDLRFQSKQHAGIEYVLINDLGASWGGHSQTIVSVGSAVTYKTGFYAGVILFVEDVPGSGNFVQLKDILAKPTTDNKVQFLIDMVGDYVNKEVEPINLASNAWFKCLLTNKKFRIVLFERSEESTYYYELGPTLAERRIFKGGLSTADFTTHADFVAGHLQANKKAMTFLPTSRKITRTQKQFISFFNWDTSSDGGGGS